MVDHHRAARRSCNIGRMNKDINGALMLELPTGVTGNGTESDERAIVVFVFVPLPLWHRFQHPAPVVVRSMD